MAAFDRNDKPDTVGLFQNGGAGSADLAVNQAQNLVADLTDNTTYCAATNSVFGVRSPREISITANLSNTQTGILVNYGDVAGTGYIYRIEISGGLVIFKQNSGTTLASISAPGIGGTPGFFVIHWSTDYDPIAASYYSEFAIFFPAGVGIAVSRVTHAQPSAHVAGYQLNLSGYGAGVSLFSGGMSNYISLRISTRFHSTIEAREDWWFEADPVSPIGYVPPIELAPFSALVYDEDPNDPVSNTILDTDTFAGPSEWLAALHAGSHRQRLYSPLLNIVINSPPPILQNTYLPANFYLLGFGGLRYAINHLYVCPVPLHPSTGQLFGRVWVHVSTWLAAGAPGGSIPTLKMIMRSADRADASSAVDYTPVTTRTADDTLTGVGDRVDLGELPLKIDENRLTYLTLGLDFSTGTGASFRRARIYSLSVDVYSKEG